MFVLEQDSLTGKYLLVGFYDDLIWEEWWGYDNAKIRYAELNKWWNEL